MTTNTPMRHSIVTGGGRGIGRAIAQALGREGFGVVVNYRSDHKSALQTAQLVEHAGGQAITVQADIGNAQDRAALLDAATEAFGRIDLLVNNAGIAPKNRQDILEISQADFDSIIQTNLQGPFMLTQQVARHMIEHHHTIDEISPPVIINISSISAYTASVNRGEYCISKAGISMMTKLFAARLAEHGICVYEIRPGIIATDMTEGVKDKYDKLIMEDGITPIRRWGKPDDIANAVTAITKGLLSFSTGQVIDVDGGFHIRRL